MAKCTCGRDISADKQFCVFCDPNVSAAQKAKWRASGGAQSKKIPHNLNPADYRPLTPESLRRLYEDLIEATIEGHRDDLAGLIRDLSKVLPRAAEVVAYENMALLNERLTQIESRRTNGRYLPARNDDAITGEFSESN